MSRLPPALLLLALPQLAPAAPPASAPRSPAWLNEEPAKPPAPPPVVRPAPPPTARPRPEPDPRDVILSGLATAGVGLAYRHLRGWRPARRHLR